MNDSDTLAAMIAFVALWAAAVAIAYTIYFIGEPRLPSRSTEPLRREATGGTPISEADARAALLRQRSEASNPEYFEAQRREHGWAFGWREDRGRPPVGTSAWVVADNGRVRALKPREQWDDAIAEELAA